MKVRESVKRFSEDMEAKLKENDVKGGWEDCNLYWLVSRINEETRELARAIDLHRDLGASKENIIKEAADVANFAMMVADIARNKLND